MSIVHCWTSRYEADGCADKYDWVIEHRADYPNLDVYEEDEGQQAYQDAEAICLREDGHTGAHRFVPTRDIRVTFLPVEK